MSRTMTSITVAVMMAGGPAMAQTATTATATPRAEMSANHLLPGQIRVTEMTGAAVYDTQGQKIGAIKDIVLDRDGRVAAVVLGVRGTLGIGGRNVAVSIEDLKISEAGGKPRFTVDMLRDQLRTAQSFNLNDAARSGTATPPENPAR